MKNEHDKEAERITKLFFKLMKKPEARALIAKMVEARREADNLERKKDQYNAIHHKAEMDLVSKFNLNPTDLFNISIAMRCYGIENILKGKNEIEKVVHSP